MINNLFLNIDAGTIDWSRAQFALTAIYHWLFVPLTLGLAVIMGIVETKYYRTRDEFWKNAAKFFAMKIPLNLTTTTIPARERLQKMFCLNSCVIREKTLMRQLLCILGKKICLTQTFQWIFLTNFVNS